MKELPNINILPVHSVDLPVQDKTIKFVPYTLDQERNVLMAMESKDIKAIVDNWRKLLSECLQDEIEIDYDVLTAMEFILLCVNLRSKSKGEVLEITTKCNKCKTPIELEIQIEDHIVTENEGMFKQICKIDDDLSFEIGPVKFDFLYAVENIKDQNELIMQTALYSIRKVIWKEEIFTGFTIDQLREKIKLTYPIVKKIFAKVNDLVKQKMVIQVKCPNKDCNHKEDYVIRDFLKYLT